MFGEMLDAEDERQIRFLMGHYVHLLDAAEDEKWAELFTEDGQWIRNNAAPVALGGSGIAAGTLTGRAALVDLVKRSISENFRLLGRHMVSDLVVWRSQDADTAHGRCRMLITDWRDGPGKISMAGNYTSSSLGRKMAGALPSSKRHSCRGSRWTMLHGSPGARIRSHPA